MIKENWFKDWFNSPYYHLLYSNRDDNEAESFIKKLIDNFSLSSHLQIIDIACGKGRHSKFISSLGYEVTGIDLSEESILEAKKDETNQLHFAQHDMREVYKKNFYDIALNLFTSFGYFATEAENQKAVTAMAANLKDGGFLVIDFLNVHKVLAQLPIQEEKNIKNIHFKIDKYLKNNFITKDIYFKDNETEYNFTEYVKNINLEQFEKYLLAAGMKIEFIFGNYQLQPFDKNDSDRLILISRKK